MVTVHSKFRKNFMDSMYLSHQMEQNKLPNENAGPKPHNHAPQRMSYLLAMCLLMSSLRRGFWAPFSPMPCSLNCKHLQAFQIFFFFNFVKEGMFLLDQSSPQYTGPKGIIFSINNYNKNALKNSSKKNNKIKEQCSP